LTCGVCRGDGLLDLAIRPDDKGVALGVLVFCARHGSIGQSKFLFGVTKEREVEVELLREGAILFYGVYGDTEHANAAGFIVLDSITESIALLGSARRIGDRIKPQHVALTGKILRLHRCAGVVKQGERWSGCARSQHGGFSLEQTTQEGAKHGMAS
jgi:hypothetical protein